MTTHTEWVGGNPFAGQPLACDAAPTKPKTEPPRIKIERAKFRAPPGRKPEHCCRTCLFSSFMKDISGNGRRDKKANGTCSLKRAIVQQADGAQCEEWEFWRMTA